MHEVTCRVSVIFSMVDNFLYYIVYTLFIDLIVGKLNESFIHITWWLLYSRNNFLKGGNFNLGLLLKT